MVGQARGVLATPLRARARYTTALPPLTVLGILAVSSRSASLGPHNMVGTDHVVTYAKVYGRGNFSTAEARCLRTMHAMLPV